MRWDGTGRDGMAWLAKRWVGDGEDGDLAWRLAVGALSGVHCVSHF